MKDKELAFIGSSLDYLREFPQHVRGLAGAELRRIQRGEQPLQGRSMRIIGAGTFEIKMKDHKGAFRVFYVTKFKEMIYVLHAFQKKSQKTSRKDIALGQQRYKEMLELRKDEKR